ncbi:MAG: hypothetical protein ABSD50_04845 [Smithella sp.]|jgi:NADP-dependent 3-hydroxy acid dehydrogenase YdfG
MKKNSDGCLDGKVALITGAADGIPRAAAVLSSRRSSPGHLFFGKQ